MNVDILIKKLRKGDKEAFTSLVNAYHKPLFLYAFNLIDDVYIAEDIVQNVFLKTWEYRKRLNPEYSIKGFLYKTTYNEFVDQFNKTKLLSPLDLSYIKALNKVIDDDNSDLLKKKIELVNKGIALLPLKCKEAFILSKKEGLTNIEISEYLNISTKTVEGHLTKAYHLLRESVGSQLKKILFLLFGNPKKV